MTPGPTCKDSKLTGWPYAWECAFLASFLVMLMLQVWGPHFENHRPTVSSTSHISLLYPRTQWLKRSREDLALALWKIPQTAAKATGLSHTCSFSLVPNSCSVICKDKQQRQGGLRSAAGLISSCQQLLYLWGHLGNHLKLEDGNKLK